MGNILSADTIYATAYLTEKGRNYLFNPIGSGRILSNDDGQSIDLFRVTSFSLSDPDVNYKLASDYIFETGDITDISGKNDGCIKGTIVKEEENMIVYQPSITQVIC
jgi:hypothetical protein